MKEFTNFYRVDFREKRKKKNITTNQKYIAPLVYVSEKLSLVFLYEYS